MHFECDLDASWLACCAAKADSIACEHNWHNRVQIISPDVASVSLLLLYSNSKLFICISFDSFFIQFPVSLLLLFYLICLGSGFIKADCFGEHAHTHTLQPLCIVSAVLFLFSVLSLRAYRMRKLWEMKRPVITNGNRRAHTLFTKVVHTSRLIIIINNLLFCIVRRLLRYTWTNSLCSCEPSSGTHIFTNGMEWNGWGEGEAHNGKWKTKETDKQTEKIAEIMTGKKYQMWLDSILPFRHSFSFSLLLLLCTLTLHTIHFVCAAAAAAAV